MKHSLGNTVEIEVPPEPLQQPAAVLRELYRAHSEDFRRQATRQGLWIAVGVYLLFSISDILLINDVAFYTVSTRFAISAVMLFLLEYQVRKGATSAAIELTAAAALIFAYAGWLYSALMTSHVVAMSYYMVFGAIFMMSVNLFFNFPFRLSLLASGIIVILFFAGLLSFPHGDVHYQLTFGIFCVSCLIFTSYVNWKLNQERYNVFLNRLEAKAQQKEANERGKALLRLSHTDPLTGLENRRAIDNRLNDLWIASQQSGAQFTAMLIDVDFFKKFNDYYGHQLGDECLVLVTDALRVLAQRHDASIGRYGGEEFILLASVSDLAKVKIIAEDIRRTVEELALPHEERRDGMSTVTVSVGATLTRLDVALKIEKVINEADKALYSAKAAGRNCVRLFDPNDPNNNDDIDNIPALLRIAIANDLVSMVYQPLQNVASGQIEAVEALMRLQMLDGKLIPPSMFIPAAERTGSILALGQWAIQKVCRDLLATDIAPVVTVNVSPLQLKSFGFATFVALTLAEHGLTGDRLAFEITEGQDMEIDSTSLRCINDLKNLGIKIWLDDFGTGFAGLSWLRLIDFDCIKIDKSFLHDSNTPSGHTMLEDIIRLGRNRGAKILVEGVETKQQLSLMRRLNVDLVQGFYIGHPATADCYKRADHLHLVRTKPELRHDFPSMAAGDALG